MKKLVSLILLILLNSCEKKTESCFKNFTYSNGNIKTSYQLQFNSSDTVYYLDYYPYRKKGLHYFLLERSEQEMLNSLICEFKFPVKDSIILNNKIEDGTTIAFAINNKRLMLHGHEGPKGFWKFEKWINHLLLQKQLIPIERKVKFEKFDKMLFRPLPNIQE